MSKSTRLLAQLGLIASFGTVIPLSVQAGGFSIVSSGENEGPGSLRHAIEIQQAEIIFIMPSVDMITLESTLSYSSRNPLRILGTNQLVKLNRNATLLAITQGADLTISNLKLEGMPGYFSIENRGDIDGQTAGKGIFLDVRDDQTGIVNLSLRDVEVRGFANHGVHVSDCSLSDECGSGAGGGGEGSSASIQVTMINSTIEDVGNGKFDADGLRVDDRGEGDIIFYSINSVFSNVGADGVELDEGNSGSIYADVLNTSFLNNGNYCNPLLLEAYLPSEPEGEFDQGEITPEQIPQAVTGSLDDSCFEREVSLYDDGSVEEYEFALDLDDGIDLDEAGAGSIYSFMANSIIRGNLDEGVDYDEADEGNIEAAFIRNLGVDNNDDAFKLSEEDVGDVFVYIKRSEALNNGGEGFTLEESGDGNLEAYVIKVTASGNKKSNKDGIEAVQEDAGTGSLTVKASDIPDGIKLEGVELR